MPVVIDTKYYEIQHGAKPHHNRRGDWTFLTPAKNRRWRWVDTAYSVACRELEERAQHNAGEGTYTLIP